MNKNKSNFFFATNTNKTIWKSVTWLDLRISPDDNPELHFIRHAISAFSSNFFFFREGKCSSLFILYFSKLFSILNEREWVSEKQREWMVYNVVFFSDYVLFIQQYSIKVASHNTKFKKEREREIERKRVWHLFHHDKHSLEVYYILIKKTLDDIEHEHQVEWKLPKKERRKRQKK